MNWMGGVQNKIGRNKKEQQKQKEFFERRRVQKVIGRGTTRGKHGVSRDILNLACVSRFTKHPFNIENRETSSERLEKLRKKRPKEDKFQFNQKYKRVFLSSGDSPPNINQSKIELDDGKQEMNKNNPTTTTSLWTPFMTDEDFKTILPSHQSTPMPQVQPGRYHHNYPASPPHASHSMVKTSSLQVNRNHSSVTNTSDYFSIQPEPTFERSIQGNPLNMTHHVGASPNEIPREQSPPNVKRIVTFNDVYQDDVRGEHIFDDSPQFTDQGVYINKNVHFPSPHKLCKQQTNNNHSIFNDDVHGSSHQHCETNLFDQDSNWIEPDPTSSNYQPYCDQQSLNMTSSIYSMTSSLYDNTSSESISVYQDLSPVKLSMTSQRRNMTSPQQRSMTSSRQNMTSPRRNMTSSRQNMTSPRRNMTSPRYNMISQATMTSPTKQTSRYTMTSPCMTSQSTILHDKACSPIQWTSCKELKTTNYV